MTDDQFLTTDEVLEYLHLKRRTLYRLVKAGTIPAVRVGRQWRFRKRDIESGLATTPQDASDARAPVTHRARVLVVDDEEAVRDFVATALGVAAPEYEVVTTADGLSALHALRGSHFDLLITDLKMPGMDGLTLIAEARRDAPELPVVIITALPSQESAIEAINLGISGYLPKPFRVSRILEVIARALSSRSASAPSR